MAPSSIVTRRVKLCPHSHHIYRLVAEDFVEIMTVHGGLARHGAEQPVIVRILGFKAKSGRSTGSVSMNRKQSECEMVIVVIRTDGIRVGVAPMPSFFGHFSLFSTDRSD